ncbi:ABC transporter substrate-binding protein [Rhodococcus erythropolis]|jgi:peptide/nickel transport system substrate-binding protein|uniref:Putative ABC transporter substrate-binding protein n=1 Tax=Rhodococcus erythropolis (strain PR4 / NBRC 100887) TaxID=234621 RepID=C0ZPJ4_RHOE4|nr:ABC transporter substrate-binding protein [Rhodococcus erythropolis]BAH35690.1 putative ABC transporter substrate-binding protein [Rhodococcus erythropolis PR4]
MKQRSYALLAAATGTVLALTACSSGGSSGSGSGGGEPVTDGTFKLALVADPGALNPLMTAASPAHQLARLSYDYLLHPDPDTGVTKPWLAEKWEETTTSASFTIRDGVTCTDGSALTAQTVADNVNFITNAANKSALRGVYAPATASATADPATRTVTVTTPEPSPFLLLNLARIPIMCEAGLKDPTAANKTTFGSGMFQMTEAVANDHYSYIRRDGYNWGPDGTTSDTAGVPKNVVASIITNNSTAANQVLSGDLNAAAVSGPDQDRMNAANLDTVKQPAPAGEMFFNHSPGNPTSDPAVRKALVQALNLDDLAEIFTAGRGTRSTTMVSIEPRACIYDSVAGNLPDFDTSAAAATLESAGWKVGADGKRSKDGTPLRIRMVYETFGDATDAAADVAVNAWNDLGATVELTSGDSNKILDVALSGKDNTAWDVVWEPINVALPSMLVPFLSGPVPAAGMNFASISNPAYDAAVTKASGLTGEDACAAWADAESEIIKANSAVPFADKITTLYFNNAGLAFGRNFIGSALRLYQ